MVELFILAVIVALVGLSLRRGKRVVLDDPLIIQCPGQYHITLAPQLHHARTFIESIAGRFADSLHHAGDTTTLCFEVHPTVLKREEDIYLLAVALRGGMLYFQAIPSQHLLREDGSQLKMLQKFSEAVLLYHPVAELADKETVDKLQRTVEDAAHQSNIDVRVLL